MNPTITRSPATDALVTGAVQFAEMGKERFLKTFAAVPEDKLNYKPSETAKSALQLAAHVAVANYGLSKVILGEPMPEMPLDQFHAFMEAEESKFTSRDQVITAIEDSTKVAVAAINTVDDSTIGNDAPSAFGSMPMTFWINLIGLHLNDHASQVDYVQTIYGDMEFHM